MGRQDMSSCTMSFNVSHTNLVCCQKTTLFKVEPYQCGGGLYVAKFYIFVMHQKLSLFKMYGLSFFYFGNKTP